MQNFDFHTHTTASDGSLRPVELIELAARQGITTLAVTDHDTISGLDAACEAGKAMGITVIPGLEISIDFEPGTMHLCGYFIDTTNQALKNGLKIVQEAREKRNPRIIEKLNEMGIDITLEEVNAEVGTSRAGRPHFAKVLLEKGYVNSIQQAFDSYLAKGAPCYVNKMRLKKAEAIALIIASGGIAVLAHPIQLKLSTPVEYRAVFSELKALGASGIEAYSSYHTNQENMLFKSLAEELDMLVTGGSDFHGATKPNVKPGVFGDDVRIDLNRLLKKMNTRTVQSLNQNY
ncbi:PHP domain-containing protein [candidate division KSB1 bacterium]|nr:PHP domain-containing protein [candidate division KSB1 bacterium]